MFARVSPLKAAWAPGTGVKESNFKANWDVDMGVTYVPWDDLPTVNIDALAVGGMVDGDSLPEHMKSESCTHAHMLVVSLWRQQTDMFCCVCTLEQKYLQLCGSNQHFICSETLQQHV